MLSHKRSKTKEYSIWCAIKARCNNPNNVGYPKYGGRGIKICDKWNLSFDAFYEDMGPIPSLNHSIDRIDVNRDYEPGNCRWATNYEQARNRTDNVWITYQGETLCVTDMCNKYNMPEKLVAERIRNGMDPVKALTKPTRTTKILVRGEELTQAEVARKYNISKSTLSARLARGLSIEEAILHE